MLPSLAESSLLAEFKMAFDKGLASGSVATGLLRLFRMIDDYI